MQDSEIRQLDRTKRTHQLVINFSPPFPEDSRGAQVNATVANLIPEIEELAARQDAAILDRQEATVQKEAAIKTLLQQMSPVSQTARSIDDQMPGIADQFKMPRDIDQEILNRARAYIESATPIAIQFTSRGLPAGFLAQMQLAIDNVLAAETRQSAALAAQTAATAGLADAFKRERAAQRELNAIMRNRFRDDPQTLAAWKSASRIERAPKRAPRETTPPPPPPVE